MEFMPDCYPCAMRQGVSAAKISGGDVSFQHTCLREVAKILSSTSTPVTPPEVGERIYKTISVLSHNPDLFRAEKKKQNSEAMAILPGLRKMIREARNPLEMAARLAIAGNVVDLGANEDFDLEKSVSEAAQGGVSFEAFEDFAGAISKSGSILYIADNCGEIVFDRLFIETIADSFPKAQITVGVRSKPIINDVTEVEAREVGIDSVARILPTGSEMPGTLLSKTTAEFKELFFGVDLVIAKGQGNWETIESPQREVYFLFKVKCPTVAEMTGVSIGTPLIFKKP
ncbi:MAG: ARMT1-like domain-containing protein [Actinomycetota bacterium]|nr:ARMT1-like domain-containing protein [Actinomycetota bacterium]